MEKLWILFVFSLSFTLVYGTPTARNSENSENEIESNTSDLNIHTFAKCSYKNGMTGLINCAALRALRVLQQAMMKNSIEIFPGVSLTSDNPQSEREAKSIHQEETLPADPQEKSEKLLGLILNTAGRFFSGRTLKIKLPEINFGLARALEEGRGKMKKGMNPLLLGIAAKLLLLKGLALAGLSFMAVKALIIAKVALILAVVFGLPSLFSGSLKDFGNFQNTGGKHGWINGWIGGTGGGYGPQYGYGTPHNGWTTNNIGGWGNSQYPYARSIDNVKEDELVDTKVNEQELAYSGQRP